MSATYLTTSQIPPELPGSGGNSVECLQWESGNAYSRFPLSDNCRLPEGFPVDAIVDACVVIPKEGGSSNDDVTLGCLHISQDLVSAMVYAGGSPVLVCTVLKRGFTPFRPYAMEAVQGTPVCSGCISFGDIRFDEYARPFLFRGGLPLSDSAVIRPLIGRLRRFVQPARSQEALGLVGVEVPDGIGVSVDESAPGVSLVRFFGDGIEDQVSVTCNPADAKLTMPPVIQTINGVHPDKDGRIAIVFAKNASEVPA